MKYDKWKIGFVDKMCDFLGILGGGILVAATVFMVANICLRPFNYTLRFIYDLCGLFAAAGAAFAIPFTTFQRGHTIMDTIIHKFKPRVRAGFEFVSGLVSIVTMVFTIYAITLFAYQKTLLLEATSSSKMPTFIFRWIYVIGMILTLAAAILETVDLYRMSRGESVANTEEEWNRLYAPEKADAIEPNVSNALEQKEGEDK